MIGLNEILIGMLIIGAVALFGRKTILKIAKEGFGLKKDLKDIAEGKEITE